jgi:signal transduction histidine kinase
VESAAPSVVGPWDPSRLERVLANLLSNAVKYSPGGGDVVVEIWPAGDWVEVRVRDQGIGIPPDEVERVFEPFHRGGNVVGVVGGTGLGLPGVRQLVREHGGSIRVERSVAGRGTELLLRLPLVPAGVPMAPGA